MVVSSNYRNDNVISVRVSRVGLRRAFVVYHFHHIPDFLLLKQDLVESECSVSNLIIAFISWLTHCAYFTKKTATKPRDHSGSHFNMCPFQALPIELWEQILLASLSDIDATTSEEVIQKELHEMYSHRRKLVLVSKGFKLVAEGIPRLWTTTWISVWTIRNPHNFMKTLSRSGSLLLDIYLTACVHHVDGGSTDVEKIRQTLSPHYSRVRTLVGCVCHDSIWDVIKPVIRQYIDRLELPVLEGLRLKGSCHRRMISTSVNHQGFLTARLRFLYLDGTAALYLSHRNFSTSRVDCIETLSVNWNPYDFPVSQKTALYNLQHLINLRYPTWISEPIDASWDRAGHRSFMLPKLTHLMICSPKERDSRPIWILEHLSLPSLTHLTYICNDKDTSLPPVYIAQFLHWSETLETLELSSFTITDWPGSSLHPVAFKRLKSLILRNCHISHRLFKLLSKEMVPGMEDAMLPKLSRFELRSCMLDIGTFKEFVISKRRIRNGTVNAPEIAVICTRHELLQLEGLLPDYHHDVVLKVEG
ncbi:hypothetical protein M422DRAFT_43188 [Sphaerobolus stellatus SS14]|nr:hypothetical protein M422DRAFT_43188 [Sphaerobolus stellatus SS14]